MAMGLRRNATFDAGQLLILGFDGAELSTEVRERLSRIQPAGVILFARNLVNPQQTHQLLKSCQAEVRTPLFTAVDLEGGRVDRFRDMVGPAPAPAEVFATQEPGLCRKHGELIGTIARALGFNLDFAPVLDLAFPASRKVMGSRAVSDNPRQVIAYARQFLAGLKRAGVLGAGKHFPGLGEGTLDSHHELPVIEKSFKKLWDEDLLPYRLLKRALPLVLVGHANYAEVTGDRLPASLSSHWISAVLRRRIGYRGLIVSDDLEMGALEKSIPIEQGAVEFIRAGGDLALLCHDQEKIEAAFEAMVHASERDGRFRRRLQESARRIAEFKRRVRLRVPALPPAEEKISRLSTQLWEFSERVRYSTLSAASAGAAR
jgi:beta-N-acetylhexosaminidase